MDLSLFNYHLPPELIAQEPKEPRDHSRLLVLKRVTSEIIHKKFYEILDFLTDQDVLVFNNSEVVKARLIGRKASTGGRVEILLIRPFNKPIFDFVSWPNKWFVIGKPNLKKGQVIEFGERGNDVLIGKIEIDKKKPSCAKASEGQEKKIIVFNKKGKNLKQEILKLGQTPLPPYIKHPTISSFRNYQTIYAKYKGSIAAPTAGFHFTEKILDKLKEKGVAIEYLTLHVGPGTFLPLKVKEIEKHQMYPEYFYLSPQVAQRLNKAKKEKKRVITVGTTVTRVLESCAGASDGFLKSKRGQTNLFIYPGYKFKFVDALLTNFHLPYSTLLMLVCAFAGRELVLKVYKKAIEEKYRFYSFGDAMFIQ